MASIVITDEYVNELFEGSRFGVVIDNCVKEKRQQLFKTLTDLTKGYWSGHMAYHIVVYGGFIVDGKSSTKKRLTALGEAFMSEHSKNKGGK